VPRSRADDRDRARASSRHQRPRARQLPRDVFLTARDAAPAQEAVDLGADRLDLRAQEGGGRSQQGRPRHPVPRHAAQDRSRRRARRQAREGVSPVLIDFLFELRRRKLPVSTHEWMALMEAMALGLHESSLDGFYQLCRTLCVKDIALYDAYDEAFLSYFKGVHVESLRLTEELQA